MSPDFKLITNAQQLSAELELIKKAKIIAVDIETMGVSPLDPHLGEMRLIQISAEKHPVLIIDWPLIETYGRSEVKKFLESDVIKIFHNAKFDLKFLFTEGISIENAVFDTCLASEVLSLGLNVSHKLKDVIKRHLDLSISKNQQTSDWSAPQLTQSQLEYAAADVALLHDLRRKLIEKLEDNDLISTAKLEFEAIPAIVQMELNGMGVNVDALNHLKKHLEKEKHQAMSYLVDCFGTDFNPDSPAQVKKALASIGVEVTSTKSEVLLPLVAKFVEIKMILDYKTISKKLQFAQKLPSAVHPKTRRIHSQYFQMGAATGRFSCSDFNLQQVPHDDAFRVCFEPSGGNSFIIADYSQMQIRIAAEISGDCDMIDAYVNGHDLHTLTASLISGKETTEVTKEMRSAAKALNFGMLFGMGAHSLVSYAFNSYGVVLSEEDASEFIDTFFKKYKGLKSWQKKVGRNITKESRTYTGRRRLFEDTGSYTQLVNTPIQGTEADILKKVLAVLPVVLKETRAKLVATVHDEIILECPEAESEVVATLLKNTMVIVAESILKKVPVVSDVSISKNWSEK